MAFIFSLCGAIRRAAIVARASNVPRDRSSGGIKNDKAAQRRPVVDPAVCQKRKSGAGEGARTLDPDLGKVVLYH
jgi:hypothetical protein